MSSYYRKTDIFTMIAAAIPIAILLVFAFLTGCQKPEDVAKYAKLEQWQSYQVTGACCSIVEKVIFT